MEDLGKLSKLIRYYILISTTEAGSGHLSSSLSATDLMTVLLFGGFFKGSDRLIFSKGHASPLLYALYAAAGSLTESQLLTLRKFGSLLEGHPAMVFPYTEVATGSLGQGLSIGAGFALAGRLDKLSCRTYVLLGDSEMAEGSVWEAIQLAAYYKLNNLVGILDVNRLGQRGQTMYGYDLKAYQKRVAAFGWKTIIIKDGHDLEEIKKAFEYAQKVGEKPVMIIAKTIKGEGVSFLEDKEGWHGKTLSEEELKKALEELGEVDKTVRARGPAASVSQVHPHPSTSLRTAVDARDLALSASPLATYEVGEMVATRKAYGNALIRIFPKFPQMVVLDAEVSNSTYAEIFKKIYPERFFEMFIAEQNMVGVALGLSRRGKIPFISTFATFFTRAFDQIRMSQYSNSNIKFVGSHAGVSIGEDGPSQMGLEDLAMFRTLNNSVVLYPSDAVSCDKLVEEVARHQGNVYLRTTRMETPVIYGKDEEFRIRGSKVHRIKTQISKLKSQNLKVTVVAAGVTVYEALKAQEQLAKEGIEILVVDLYSIKPLDVKTLKSLAKESKFILTVEDHYPAGGLGEAVKDALSTEGVKIYSLAVRKIPTSGKPAQLLKYEEIDAQSIVEEVSRQLRS